MTIRKGYLPHNASEASSRRMASLERRVRIIEGNPFVRSTSDLDVNSLTANLANVQTYINQFVGNVGLWDVTVDPNYADTPLTDTKGGTDDSGQSGPGSASMIVNGNGYEHGTSTIIYTAAGDSDATINEEAISQQGHASVMQTSYAFNGDAYLNLAVYGTSGSNPANAYAKYQSTGAHSSQYTTASQTTQDGNPNLDFNSIARGSGQANVHINAISSNAQLSGWTDSFPAGSNYGETQSNEVSSVAIDIASGGSESADSDQVSKVLIQINDPASCQYELDMLCTDTQSGGSSYTVNASVDGGYLMSIAGGVGSMAAPNMGVIESQLSLHTQTENGVSYIQILAQMTHDVEDQIVSSGDGADYPYGVQIGAISNNHQGDQGAYIQLNMDGTINITGDVTVSGTLTSGGGDSLAAPESLTESKSAAPKMGRASFEGNGMSRVLFDIPHPTGVADTDFVASPRGAWTGEVHADGMVDDGTRLSLQATTTGRFENGRTYNLSFWAA